MSANGRHDYRIELRWTGAAGGFRSYEDFDRTHRIAAPGKPSLTTSSDPAFLGVPELWNPEDMLVAALSSCHMLSYLACCARARIEVLDYSDEARGTMVEDGKGGGRFTEVVLEPRVVIADAVRLDHARRLHGTAHRVCFIANSVNFDVIHNPEVVAR
ncbi:OsmC family protein [Minwuia thermotolerans]|uniref:OsmC family protein n=1 Tax=Minwuia thermotolerans TaxID=2056226 RepID=UPI0019D0BFAD|nr:OsmC family protein [Minwuia thermotolerans]